jgi:cyclopropane-fatty-acyl-phospholipid synthase
MDKWWDCERLDEFFSKILRAGLDEKVKNNLKYKTEMLLARIFNYQSITHAFHNVKRHYDIGNDLFTGMLDKRMMYTCAFWKGSDNLDEAQKYKLDLTCRKLNLKAGMHVLDIGCGWGGFARFAAEKYGVTVTGITLSKEQAVLAKQFCKGLPVNIVLKDYRMLHEKFDAIVSLGMFEHVGYKNYRLYMKTVQRCLKDNGLFLLHTIGSNRSSLFADTWLNKYIFPGSMIPSVARIGQAIEGLFVMEHWENFSVDYDKTLMAWHYNFVSNWDKIKTGYDETFFRMWKYYLLSCAGSFRARNSQLWQIVLSRDGVEGGYKFKRALLPSRSSHFCERSPNDIVQSHRLI